MRVNSLVTMRKRMLIVILTVVFLFVALLGRLTYLQIINGKPLQTKAAEQWYRDLPLQAPRGTIFDMNKQVLADNKDVYTVYVRPKAVKNPDSVASILAYYLDIDRDSLLTKINSKNVSEITVKRAVDDSIANKLIELGLDGVYFTLDSKRNYPYSNLLSQVIGFTNIDNQGQNGIEGYYDKYLTGTNGFAYTATDIKGVELASNVTRYVPAIKGSDLTLTVDIKIQEFAVEAVKTACKEFNAKSASMLIMNAKTGGITAMAIAPDFDLNDIPRNDINLLNALSKNTLLVDVYEPGSTFKIFTTASAIENGVTSDKKTYFCPGYRMVDGQRIRCWRSIGHGSQHLAEGVKNSCNCVFMDLAQSLGTQRLYRDLKSFGFGAKTGIDFFGESAGIMMNEKTVKTVDLARIGFGQAIAVTPLQLVSGACAVVNGGTLYTPYLVQSASLGGTEYYKREPQSQGKVISQSTSEKMREMLTAVVAEGGGKKAGVPGFLIGGKTGTAQKYEGGSIAQGKYISSFLGFAPADNPEYVMLMIVDEPQGYMYYGSLVAAPYAGQVFAKIFDYKGMQPSKVNAVETVIMPELTGKPLQESISALKALGLQYELVGEGSTVISTVPIATTALPKGDIVLLRT